jgi:hypothetical protein
VQEEKRGVLPTCPAYIILLVTSFCRVFFLLAFQCGESQAKHGKHSNEERQVHLFCFTGKDKSLSSVLGRLDSTHDGLCKCPSTGQDLATGVSQGL